MRLSSHVGGGGWPGGAGGLPPGPLGASSGNYFGDGADGDVVITSSTQLASTTDGDMLVKHYKSLTVNAGAVLTVANRCRGILLYVDGDLTVNGSIAMTGRGCNANPATAGTDADTPVAPGDGHAVPAGGIVIRRKKAGSTDSNVDTTLFHGCGAAAVAAEARQGRVLGNGKVWALPRVGGLGGPGRVAQGVGNTGQTKALSPGGGASGSEYYQGTSAAGGDATCFGGGSGSGGGDGPGAPATSNYCGPGGPGARPNGTGVAGGAGNPGGIPSSGGQGQSGVGGLLIIIVRGNVYIGASGQIVSHGLGGGATGVPGGGSGGGNILILYGGTYTNNGTVAASGGQQGDGTPWGIVPAPAGGAGSVTVDSIDN